MKRLYRLGERYTYKKGATAMRDRLIERLKEAETKVKKALTGKSAKPLSLEEWIGIYADHLIANGAILPPVKVGQTVWFIGGGKMVETNAEKIILKQGGIYIKLGCNAMYETSCNSIGKTVFLTEEDAEKALKEKEV